MKRQLIAAVTMTVLAVVGGALSAYASEAVKPSPSPSETPSPSPEPTPTPSEGPSPSPSETASPSPPRTVTPVPAPTPTTVPGSGPSPTASDPLASDRLIVRSTFSEVEDREEATATDLRPRASVANERAPTPTPDPVTPSVMPAPTPAVISGPNQPPAQSWDSVAPVGLLIAALLIPLLVWAAHQDW